MLKQLLFSTFLLLLAFQFFLFCAKPILSSSPCSIKQENLIKCQRLLYSSKVPDKIICGSSMAGKLPDKTAFNLALAGGGCLDGLQVLRKSGKIPKILLLESNYYFKRLEEDFSNQLFRFPKNKMATLSLFREENKPLNLLIGALKGKKRSRTEAIDSLFFRNIVGSKLKAANKAPTEKMIKEAQAALKMMKKEVNYFEKQGTMVLFFEMPMFQGILDAVAFKERAVMFKQWFPVSDFNWLPNVSSVDYPTIDGVHLSAEAQSIYSNFILQSLKKEEWK